MVQIPDQFETEPSSFFSGSYTDDVFIEGMSIFHRRPVYYSAARPTVLPPYDPTDVEAADSVVFNRLMGYTGSLSAIRGPLTLDRQLTGLVAGRSTSNVARKFRCEGEIFADSVLYAPPDVVLINGGQLVEGDDYAGDGGLGTDPTSIIKGGKVGQGPRKFKIVLGTSSSLGYVASADNRVHASLTASDGSQVSDDVWAYSFPFENRYVGLQRYIKPGFNKSYGVALTQSCVDPSIVVSENDQVDYPHFSSSIYSIQYLYKFSYDDGTHPGLYATIQNDQTIGVQKWDTPSGFDVKETKYGRIEDILVGFYGFYSQGNYGVIPEGYNAATTANVRSNPGKFPSFGSIYELESKAAPHRERQALLQPRVNGWKQGVYHALPTPSFCYFRYNRYGHFRDMFEQRPDTKYHDATKKGVLDAPVRVRFVKDSSPFVTASQPLTLNPNVSGNFDFEGKMGRPFNDSATGSI